MGGLKLILGGGSGLHLAEDFAPNADPVDLKPYLHGLVVWQRRRL